MSSVVYAQCGDEAEALERRFLELLPVIQGIVSFLARRYYLHGCDLEDFSSDVFVKLIEDDYAVLRKFRRSSSVKTYLTVTIARLLIDRTNREWGRWRPSAEARRNGRVAVLLEKLVVRDSYTFEEACETLMTNHHVSLSRVELERLFGRLPARSRRRFESLDTLTDLPASTGQPDSAIVCRDGRTAAARLISLLSEAMRSLPAQERLILKMRFEDGLTIAAIAAALRLDSRKLYSRIERLHARLRTALMSRGIGVDDVDLFLAHGEAD